MCQALGQIQRCTKKHSIISANQQIIYTHGDHDEIKVARNPTQRQGHSGFDSPSKQMADDHSRAELSHPGTQDKTLCSGVMGTEAAVTGQNLGVRPVAVALL